MKALSAVPSDVLSDIGQIGVVDLVIGVPSFNNGSTIRRVIETAAQGAICYLADARTIIVNADGGSTDDTPHVVQSTSIPDSVELVSFAYQGVAGKGSALRAVFEVAERLKAQACIVLDADLRSVTPSWVDALAQPVLHHGYDFVAPLYIRHRNDGTITNNLAYPLTRALYGWRVRQPIGGDFGISGRLAACYLAQDVWATDVARFGIDIFMTTVAINEGFRVCQSKLGAKVHDAKDPALALEPMFVQVVGTLFALLERYQQRWLNVSGSAIPPTFGKMKAFEPEPVSVTTTAMINRFKAGVKSSDRLLHNVLEEQTYEEITALAELTQSDFHFSADLWARLVYDFAVAYHRADHLKLAKGDIVKAMVPFYLGRTASVAIEGADLDSVHFEQLVEEQARIFEIQKLYLFKRWSA